MTHYATCVGCVGEKACFIRDVFRLRIKGLGLTTVKWRCKSRADRFPPGSPVWAITVADMKNPTFDEDSREYGRGCGPERDTFPGIVIKSKGSSALVYIHAGAKAQGDDAVFVGGPVCRIPLSRISARDAEPETICRSCLMPSSVPHIDGYYCNREVLPIHPVTTPSRVEPEDILPDEEWAF